MQSFIKEASVKSSDVFKLTAIKVHIAGFSTSKTRPVPSFPPNSPGNAAVAGWFSDSNQGKFDAEELEKASPDQFLGAGFLSTTRPSLFRKNKKRFDDLERKDDILVRGWSMPMTEETRATIIKELENYRRA
ncbi:hypothetical protein B0H65DRAFT_591138 [Neurospora tetraspora]|uniref:Uncharacterized protein n=1 Tax=Neurospora tetraspora TaxID=94610 RepID=A0AAE0J7X4_9PEZI|nr:hypothetical protein B0H65DRAFT_591138 [Neurospora tetraspora]